MAAKAEKEDDASKVRVVCRFRPHNDIEETRGDKPCIKIKDDNTEVYVKVRIISLFQYLFGLFLYSA